MVRSKYLLAAAVAVAAGLTVYSCTKKEESQQESKVGFATTDAQFSQDGIATLSLAVSPAASSKVSVIIAAGSEAQEGFTAVPATALSFESSVSIEAGATEATVEVSVDLAAVEDGQQAVLTLSAANGATIDAQKATAYIKVVKAEEPADLSGASVWGLIGGFNEWGADVELTKTADSPEKWEATGVALSGEFKFRGNKEWGDYDLGAAQGFNVVPGEEFALVHKGSNITIAEGTYDIVLYPTELKAVITASEVAPPDAGSLDWKAEYKGCNWVEGYYSEGQLEVFEVSGTDGSYYYPVIIDLAEEDSIIAALQANPDATLAQIQEEITAALEEEMEMYEEDLEEAMYWVLYNEENDGSEIYFYGLPAGNYEFAIFPVDAEGKITKTFKAFPFDHPEDALELYVWNEQYNLNSDWGAEYDGWDDEGKTFWITGNAAGAAYVYCQWYTDDEIADYFGTVDNYINSTASQVYDYAVGGADLVEDLGLAEVASDGSFDALLSTYSEDGPYNVYIVAFDANGNVLPKYGVSLIETEEVIPIEWVEKTSWAVNYDPTVDTGYADYPQAIVVTACDAKYFDVSVFKAGTVADYGIEAIADNVGDWASTLSRNDITMDYLVENGYMGSADTLPFISPYNGLSNGLDIVILAYDENGKFTGEWYSEILTGLEETPVEPLELTFMPDWSVTLTDGTFDGKYSDCVVNAPGILWYFLEEDTDEDLDNYYDGSIETLATSYESQIAQYMNQGYTMDDLLYSGSDPQDEIRIWNPGVQSKIYIFEYNEQGKATGRYGVSDVLTPSEVVASSPAKTPAVKKAAIAKKTVVAKKSVKSSSTVLSHRTYAKVAKKVRIANSNALQLKSKAPASAAPKHGKKIVLSK